jgi:hypothetical protein
VHVVENAGGSSWHSHCVGSEGQVSGLKVADQKYVRHCTIGVAAKLQDIDKVGY